MSQRVFSLASQGDLIIAHRKDASYLESLVYDSRTVVSATAGNQWTSHHTDQLSWIVRCLYGLLNVVGSSQSLGEEYTSIAPISTVTGRLASNADRWKLFFLGSVAPVCALWMRAFMRRFETHFDSIRLARLRSLFRVLEPKITENLCMLDRIHLVLFYLTGMYYLTSNRIANIRHVALYDQPSQPSYRILGLMLGIQVLASTLRRLQSDSGAANDSESHMSGLLHANDDTGGDASNGSALQKSDEDIDKSCSLCLDTRQLPTVAACGHIYCWSCIREWCMSKSECPMCRRKFQAQSLVRVFNHP